MRAVILGDSQGDGIKAPLEQILARHELALDNAHTWTSSGAPLSAITAHVANIGAADLVVVFSGGGNDGALVSDQNRYGLKLADLVAALRAGGARDVVFVGPMISTDPAVQAQHEAARLVQSRGIPGARWVDGFQLSRFVPHPDGNPTHYSVAGYRQLAVELEKAIWQRDTVAAIGLVGTLTFLGGLGMVLMEWWSRDEVV